MPHASVPSHIFPLLFHRDPLHNTPHARWQRNRRDVGRLDEDRLDRIRATLHTNCGQALKPVFDALGGPYSYEVLRCVKVAGQGANE